MNHIELHHLRLIFQRLNNSKNCYSHKWSANKDIRLWMTICSQKGLYIFINPKFPRLFNLRTWLSDYKRLRYLCILVASKVTFNTLQTTVSQLLDDFYFPQRKCRCIAVENMKLWAFSSEKSCWVLKKKASPENFINRRLTYERHKKRIYSV